MSVTPVLSAIMCDGLGWFSEVDYKRALLVYDEILYLLPTTTLKFRDVTGEPAHLIHSSRFTEAKEFRVHSFRPDDQTRELLRAAAQLDAADSQFTAIVNRIPDGDRLYTWRATNADGDIGGSDSIGLRVEEQVLAHALLLNKFLLAAGDAGAIPITGKAYIHHLLGAKYQMAMRSVGQSSSHAIPDFLRRRSVSYDAALQQIVGNFVSDEDLDGRSYDDILKFKATHQTLFERFSLLMRQSIERIQSVPASPSFHEEVADLVNTDLWKEKAEIEEHLRSSWQELFGTPAKTFMSSPVFRWGAAATTSGMILGILPALDVRSLSLAALAAPGAIASTWLLERAMDYFHSHREGLKHGLYYLMRFSE
jgi:hypothetical protein